MKILVLYGAIFVGIFSMWAYQQREDKAKSAKIAELEKTVSELEKASEQSTTAQTENFIGKTTCIYQAQVTYDNFLKRNATTVYKDGSLRAPVYAFELARATKATDLEECRLRYGQ